MKDKRKNYISVILPDEQPDRCTDCPLLGLIPKQQRPKGSKESHVCLGTCEAMGARFARVKASERDTRHPHLRPCDALWYVWTRAPRREYRLRWDRYLQYREPYEQGQQMQINFHTKPKDNEQ